MLQKLMLTAARARELFDYDPETGVLRWRPRPECDFASARTQGMWNTRFARQIAGSLDSHGYLRVRIDGVAHAVHRVIWLLVTGEWPPAGIDHGNHVRNDNRWTNIDAATQAENRKNASLMSNNKSGHNGVSWHEGTGKWQVHVGGRDGYLGVFASLDDAAAARRKANLDRGYHENHGREAA